MEVTVANARKLRAIYDSDRKCDKLDARMLAKLLMVDPELLHPIHHNAKRQRYEGRALFFHPAPEAETLDWRLQPLSICSRSRPGKDVISLINHVPPLSVRDSALNDLNIDWPGCAALSRIGTDG